MVERARPGPHVVLLAEDNPSDVFFVREALTRQKIEFELDVVEDGQAAIAHLCNGDILPNGRRPDLILLDLNLPKRDGREVLEEIKKDDELGRIPVVVLTTSSADEDILRSYQLHANAYVTKPVDFERFIAVIRQIDEFFVSVVKLPPRA